MLQLVTNNIKHIKKNLRYYTTTPQNVDKTDIQFQTVFTLPSIKYISLLNRLKVYQMVGTPLIVSGCGLLEVLNALPHQSFLSAAYIGLTGTAVLSITSLPFRNTIGILYISEDNKYVKISSMDFWGRRKNKIVAINDWIPLIDIEPKITDTLYLQPHLADGTKYKWFVKFGNVLNSSKIGLVLE